MDKKKDIGDLFGEQLKSFERAPSDQVWFHINAELDKKPSRSLSPLWIWSGLIVVGLILGTLYLTISPEIAAPSPSQDELQTVKSENTFKDSSIEPPKSQSSRSIKDAKALQFGQPLPSANLKNTDTTASITEAVNNNGQPQQKSRWGKTNNSTSANSKQLPRDQTLPIVTSSPQLVEGNSLDSKEKKSYTSTSANHRESLTQYGSENKNSRQIKLILDQPLAESILAVEKAQKEKTTGKRKTAPTQSKKKEEVSDYRIAISPYTSLLSYGSLAKGSSIDDRLANNPREAIATQGYGIKIDYLLSEKASLRLGLGFSPLKYRTDNFQVFINNGIVNVYQLSNLVPQQVSTAGAPVNPSTLAFFQNNDIVNIEQEISYLEIPLEYQYRLLNKRFDLSLSSGISLLVLSQNEVYAVANDGQRLLLGEERGLKRTSLAFNFGLGAHYNISNYWRFNAEPIFKYQFNPYDRNQSNFRPYYVGLQLGISYKF